MRDAVSDPDSITIYQAQIDGWQEYVDDNEALYETVEDLPAFTVKNDAGTQSFEDIAFSAGANVSRSITDKDGTGDGSTEGSTTSLKKDFSKTLNVFGITLKVKTGVKGYYEYNKSSGTGDNTEVTYGFSLADNDLGDQFDVLVRKDSEHTYATPIFRAEAGRSMCPVEPNTQAREGVDLLMQNDEDGVAETTIRYGDLEDQISYPVEFRNTQVAYEEAGTGFYKTYKLKVYNNQGAIIRYDGARLDEGGKTIVLESDGDEAIKTGNITVERNDATPELLDFEDISIVMYSACEESGGSLGYYDGTDVNLADTLYLSAHFHSPCVESIEMIAPVENWVVNNEANNELTFRFKTENPDASFDNLLVEYSGTENNEPELLEEIDPSTLVAEADGYYSVTVDVGSLTDAQYRFRLTPQCGIGPESWREENPTGWITGSIYRSAPIITEVTPTDNNILTEGLISATYNRAINPNGANSLNIALRGILGGYEYTPTSVELNTATDDIVIPEVIQYSVDSTHTNPLDVEGAYTVEFWVNPYGYPTAGSEYNILRKGDNYTASITSTGKLNNGREESSEGLAPFQWTHVAIVYDGDRVVSTYFDGALASSEDQIVRFTTNDEDFVIGGDGFVGLLDEVRIWDHARSSAEIITDRTTGLLGNESGLLMYLVLDENALDGEAVRDFVGNTHGTTATGLSWVYKEEAAPMTEDEVIQDIPIDVVLSGDRQILITPKSSFPEYYLEGAELTAYIADNSIEDVYGNKAEGTSWSFVINKNDVSWANNNLSIKQTQGEAISFAMDLSNDGATDATYEIIDLPVWLSVADGKAQDVVYDLPYGYTHTLSFETVAWLNPGIHTTHVKVVTYNPDGSRSGVESFFLEVAVNCEAPEYSFDQNQYAGWMNLTATLTIDGDLSEDTDDQVAAYLNGELRGVGNVAERNGEYLVQMSIYGDYSETGTLDFRVWDASSCREYQGVPEDYTFAAGTSTGSISSPVTLTTGDAIMKRMPISAGYQQLSFALHDAGVQTLSLSSVEGFNTGDFIQAQDGSKVTYDATTGWSGEVTALDFKQSYLVYANADTDLEVYGLAADVATNIDLTTGTDWAAYLPEEMLTTGMALRSLTATTATDGDQVSGREGFAEYVAGTGWVGSLTHMTPNLGYQITSAQEGTLNYSGIAITQSNAVITNSLKAEEAEVSFLNTAQTQGWTVNAKAYPEMMYITGVLQAAQLNTEESHLIGAFVGDEFRGTAIPQKIGDKVYYFITVCGGREEGEEISFRLMEGNTVYTLENTLSFEKSNTKGNYQTPYTLVAGEVTAAEEGLGYALQNYPNPMEEETVLGYTLPQPDKVTMTIFNTMGQAIITWTVGQQDAGNHTIKWDGKDSNGNQVKAGAYIYEMSTPNQRLRRKLIKH